MLHTISLIGEVGAGSTLVLASREIGFPFRIIEFSVSFALNQERLVEISPYVSGDPETPASGTPSGTNLLQYLSNQAYLVGDDDIKKISMNYEHKSWPSWLKVYVNNVDAFAQDVDCYFIIEDIPQEGGA